MIYLTRKVEPNFVTIVLQIQLFKIHKIQNSISPCKVEGVRDSVHKIIVLNWRGNGKSGNIFILLRKLVSTPPPPLDLTALCSTAARTSHAALCSDLAADWTMERVFMVKVGSKYDKSLDGIMDIKRTKTSIKHIQKQNK